MKPEKTPKKRAMIKLNTKKGKLNISFILSSQWLVLIKKIKRVVIINPIIPPTRVNKIFSNKICPRIWFEVAPNAFLTPISADLSNTLEILRLMRFKTGTPQNRSINKPKEYINLPALYYGSLE